MKIEFDDESSDFVSTTSIVGADGVGIGAMAINTDENGAKVLEFKYDNEGAGDDWRSTGGTDLTGPSGQGATVDTLISSSSTNPVTSTAIYSALETIGLDLHQINLIDSSLWDLVNESGSSSLSWSPNSSSPQTLLFGTINNNNLNTSNERPFAITKNKIIDSRLSEIILRVTHTNDDENHRLDIRFFKDYLDEWMPPVQTSGYSDYLDNHDYYGVTLTRNSDENAYFVNDTSATPALTNTFFSSNSNWPLYNVNNYGGPSHRRILIRNGKIRFYHGSSADGPWTFGEESSFTMDEGYYHLGIHEINTISNQWGIPTLLLRQGELSYRPKQLASIYTTLDKTAFVKTNDATLYEINRTFAADQYMVIQGQVTIKSVGSSSQELRFFNFKIVEDPGDNTTTTISISSAFSSNVGDANDPEYITVPVYHVYKPASTGAKTLYFKYNKSAQESNNTTYIDNGNRTFLHITVWEQKGLPSSVLGATAYTPLQGGGLSDQPSSTVINM